MNTSSKILLFTLFAFAISTSYTYAQKAKPADIQSDSSIFVKQIVTLKEYKAEKRKMDSLFKATGEVARASYEIDNNVSEDGNDEQKNIITGYIKEERGAVNVIAYEVKFDCKKKKIISVNNELDGVDVSTGDD